MTGIASRLYAQRRRPTRLSPYCLMSDPDRTPDIIGAVRDLPRGAAIIYRHFGAPNRTATAHQLRQISFKQGLQFLIGDDPDLAILCGADGVHFRRGGALASPLLWRQRCPDWIITMAGLKGEQSYSGDLSVLDGLFISSVFSSNSPSAGPAIGLSQLKSICDALPAPIFALGGVNQKTAPRLVGTGVSGFAGVSGLL